MYKTILVPHGGTLAGDEAIKHAINLAKSYSAKIVLLHVVEPMPTPPDAILSDSQRQILLKDIDEVNTVIKRAMTEKLDEYITECQKEGLVAEKKVLVGDAATEILRSIQELNIDLIVMGKHKKTKNEKTLLTLGDVSRKILENTTCPIFLIDVQHI